MLIRKQEHVKYGNSNEQKGYRRYFGIEPEPFKHTQRQTDTHYNQAQPYQVYVGKNIGFNRYKINEFFRFFIPDFYMRMLSYPGKPQKRFWA